MVPYQNPTIYPGGVRVDEPITVLTDLLVVAVCVFGFFKTRSPQQSAAIKLYRWFLLVTGISTFVSAIIGHAFLYCFDFNAKIFGWITGIASVIFAQFAAIYHSRKHFSESTVKLLIWANSIEIIAAFILLFVYFTFVIVEIHSALGLLLVVVPLETIHYKRTLSPLSKGMLTGIAIAVLAIICHIFKLAVSVWFNHMDLSHIIMAIGIFAMYKGISATIKQENTTPLT